MIREIIEKCLNACISLDREAMLLSFIERQMGESSHPSGNEYEKSRIFYALKSILVFHD